MEQENRGDIAVKLRDVIKRWELAQGRDLTQTELSEATGISQSTLSDWINDKVGRFDEPVLVRLCAFFGVGVCELLTFVPAANGREGGRE